MVDVAIRPGVLLKRAVGGEVAASVTVRDRRARDGGVPPGLGSVVVVAATVGAVAAWSWISWWSSSIQRKRASRFSKLTVN